jgi:hypothetical protein
MLLPNSALLTDVFRLLRCAYGAAKREREPAWGAELGPSIYTIDDVLSADEQGHHRAG